jgi:hypothetical protein
MCVCRRESAGLWFCSIDVWTVRVDVRDIGDDWTCVLLCVCVVIYGELTGAVTELVHISTARVDVTDLDALMWCVRWSGCGTLGLRDSILSVLERCSVATVRYCVDTPMDTGRTVRSGGLEGFDIAYRRLALVRMLCCERLLSLLGYVWPG